MLYEIKKTGGRYYYDDQSKVVVDKDSNIVKTNDKGKLMLDAKGNSELLTRFGGREGFSKGLVEVEDKELFYVDANGDTKAVSIVK